MTQLYAFLPCAPKSPLFGNRGLHPDIDPIKGYSVVRKRYRDDFVDRLGNIGAFYQNPWGRSLPFIKCVGLPAVTAMRSDQKLTADKHAAYQYLSGALTASIYSSKHDSILYVGGNPATGPVMLGYYPLLMSGVGMAFDAAAAQSDTELVSRLIDFDDRGCRVLVEANLRQSHSLPCVAKWSLWGKNDRRYGFDDAPDGSLCWFPKGIASEEEWLAADKAVDSGLGLVVNLLQTRDIDRLAKRAGE